MKTEESKLEAQQEQLDIPVVTKRYFCKCGWVGNISNGVLLYPNDKFSETLCPNCKDIMYINNVC